MARNPQRASGAQWRQHHKHVRTRTELHTTGRRYNTNTKVHASDPTPPSAPCSLRPHPSPKTAHTAHRAPFRVHGLPCDSGTVASAQTIDARLPRSLARWRAMARDGPNITIMRAPRSTGRVRSSNGDALATRLRVALGGRDRLLLLAHHEDGDARDEDHGDRRADGDAGNRPDAQAVIRFRLRRSRGG